MDPCEVDGRVGNLREVGSRLGFLITCVRLVAGLDT